MLMLMVLILEHFVNFFNNHPFNQLIENGHIYLAQPPLFKVTKANKSVYIKDEKALEEYIFETAKIEKKIKKGSKEYKKYLQESKGKTFYTTF